MENNNLKSDDVKNLMDFIEYNSEHSRWSTAITLLISITVASLIAFLGSFVELQDLNYFFYNQEPEPITINVPIDSIHLIIAKKEVVISDYIQQTTIQKDTSQTSNTKDSTLTGSENKSNCLCETIKEEEDNQEDIDKIQFNYFVKKNTSGLKLSAFQLLFLCTTFLGFLFTLFFYILRRKIDLRMMEIKNIIETENRAPEFIVKRLTEISNDILILKNEIKDKTGGVKNNIGGDEKSEKELKKMIAEIKCSFDENADDLLNILQSKK